MVKLVEFKWMEQEVVCRAVITGGFRRVSVVA